MEPDLPILPIQTGLAGYFGFPNFYPGIFESADEGNEFLNNLDSDTRDYVIKHTEEFRTRSDVINCINELHGKG